MTAYYVVPYNSGGTSTDYQYNGNGLASGPAASPGASGAWNNLITALEGGGGSVAPGDILNIRSSDQDGNSITVQDSGDTILYSVYNSTEDVKYLVDDGTIWASPATLTWEGSSTGSQFQNGAYAHFDGNNRFVIQNNTTGTSSIALVVVTGVMCNFKVRLNSNCTTTGAQYIALTTGDYTGWLFNVDVDVVKQYSNSGSNVFATTGASVVKMSNIKVACLDTATVEFKIMGGTNQDNTLYIDGMELSGFGNGVYLSNNDFGLRAQINNVKTDAANNLIVPYTTRPDADEARGLLTVNQGNSDLDEVIAYHPRGEVGWRNDNYPTLNAVLREGSPWSIRVRPVYSISAHPLEFLRLRKKWNATADELAITLEFLFNEFMTGYNKSSIYLLISYWDENDNMRLESTKGRAGDTVALSSSTANWSAIGYGADDYDKYKVTHTTAYKVLLVDINTSNRLVSYEGGKMESEC